jgi:hypothetical protein
MTTTTMMNPSVCVDILYLENHDKLDHMEE